MSQLPDGRVYKTQLDASAFLRDRGFKVSKSTFNRDIKLKKLATNADGQFDESALLAYATVYLTPTGQFESKSMTEATASRLNADADLKKYQAERQKLKLEQEQGKTMYRADHERDLAARALFFKREVENFIHLHGPGIIHLVGGDEGRLTDLVAHWGNVTAEWMNAWAQEREFLVPDAESEEDETPEIVEHRE